VLVRVLWPILASLFADFSTPALGLTRVGQSLIPASNSSPITYPPSAFSALEFYFQKLFSIAGIRFLRLVMPKLSFSLPKSISLAV